MLVTETSATRAAREGHPVAITGDANHPEVNETPLWKFVWRKSSEGGFELISVSKTDEARNIWLIGLKEIFRKEGVPDWIRKALKKARTMDFAVVVPALLECVKIPGAVEAVIAYDGHREEFLTKWADMLPVTCELPPHRLKTLRGLLRELF